MMRALHPAQLPVIAAIHQAAFPPDQAWSAAAFATLLAGPGTWGWLDERGAFILFRGAAGQADLLTLATHPARRRQGLARALLQASLAALAGDGIGRVVLEVAEDNGPAVALYRRCGFAEIGRRAGYYPGGGDAVVMATEC